MQNAIYDTDLTDEQWQYLEPLLPPPKSTGRPRIPLRPVINARLYLAKTGCQWRLLPQNFPAWQTVYGHFRRWQTAQLWSALNDRLRARVRECSGKRSRPTASILDSQSVRSSAHGGLVGYDAGKKIKGRKRFVLVDTLGLVLGVQAESADTPERAGAMLLLAPLLQWFSWLRKLWVDGGYQGDDFIQGVEALRPKLDVEVVKRSDDVQGFKVLPRRWVVERTFAWLMVHRRLARDYEQTTASATAWVYIAMIRLMLRRLA